MSSHGSLGAVLRIGTPGLTKPRKRGGMSRHAHTRALTHMHAHARTHIHTYECTLSKFSSKMLTLLQLSTAELAQKGCSTLDLSGFISIFSFLFSNDPAMSSLSCRFSVTSRLTQQSISRCAHFLSDQNAALRFPGRPSPPPP